MAIYHMSVKTVGRSGGRSATGAAAYRSGERIECERYGLTHDYTRKQGVEHCEIFLPHGAPRWARERSKLWNTAEQKETRKNSTVAREFELALPHELTNDQRIELVKSFSERLVHRHRMAVDACIHAPDKQGNNLNHHAHILCTTRRLSEDGFTEKTRELDVKNSGEVDHWREVWADMVNEHLQRASVEARVDHRTLEAQRAEAIEQGDKVKAEALNYEPTIHEGAKVRHMSKRGIETNRARQNAELEEAKIIHLEAFRAKQKKLKGMADIAPHSVSGLVSPEPVQPNPLTPANFTRVLDKLPIVQERHQLKTPTQEQIKAQIPVIEAKAQRVHAKVIS